MRREQCLCGDWIEAPNLDESAPAVREHYRSVLHLVWRQRGGFDQIPVTKPRTWLEMFDGYEHRRVAL